MIDPVPLHVCFSGALACSGCNPCPECREVVKETTLPAALIESGLPQLSQVLFDLVTALGRHGIDPAQHLGVQIPPTLRSTQEVSVAFFQGYSRGWGSLHSRMGNGDLAGRFVTQPIVKLGDPPPPVDPLEAPRAAAGLDLPIAEPHDREDPPSLSSSRWAAGLPPVVSRTAVTVAPDPVLREDEPPQMSGRFVDASPEPLPAKEPPITAEDLARMMAVPAAPNNAALNGRGPR